MVNAKVRIRCSVWSPSRQAHSFLSLGSKQETICIHPCRCTDDAGFQPISLCNWPSAAEDFNFQGVQDLTEQIVQVEGMKITVEDIIGSTGLELKVDPGVPWVYAGFAG